MNHNHIDTGLTLFRLGGGHCIDFVAAQFRKWKKVEATLVEAAGAVLDYHSCSLSVAIAVPFTGRN